MTFQTLEHGTPEFDHLIIEKLAAMAAGRTGLAIEVGTWVGSTALTIAPFFKTLYCIDTFKGNPTDGLRKAGLKYGPQKVLETFCANIKDGGGRLLVNIIPCVGESVMWANMWPFPVDFIFIDADHRYEHVLADIQAWQPHVRGILCGHDYSKDYPGVKRAVEESFETFENAGNMWWVEI